MRRRGLGFDWSLTVLACFIVLLCLCRPSPAETLDGPLVLSPEERAWLDHASPIRFAYDPEFAPFELTDARGDYAGVAAEYLALIAQLLNAEIQWVPGDSWSASMEAVREGRVDMLPCIGFNEERAQFLTFSEPYLEFARVVVTRLDVPYFGLASLPDERIAVQRDSSHHGYLLATTDLDPVLFSTFREAMLALAAGNVDAVVGNLATAAYVIQNSALANLMIAGRLGDDTFSLHMAVRHDLEPLVPLLNRALQAISLQERTRILDQWIPLPRLSDPTLHLTREEREWLVSNPRIRVGWDPAWAPVEFAASDGRPNGFSIDIIRELERKLGIRFEFGPPVPWIETLHRLEARELDMVSCTGPVEGRERFMTLTESYLTAPVVLYARGDHPFIRHLGQMAGKRIAVPSAYAEEAWLVRDFPEIVLHRVSSVEDGLRAVKDQQADAFIGSVMQGNYYLSMMRNWPLSIAGETPYDNVLHMGVRSDWPEFVSILNKALRDIPEARTTEFYRKWVWVEYLHGIDYGLVIRVALAGVVGILLFFLWNRRLSREVRLRGEAEKLARESRDALEKSYDQLKHLEEQKENLTQMIVHDLRSPLTVIISALELSRPKSDEGPARGPSPVDDDLLAMAHAAAHDITHIVDSLLDVARLEEGKMPVTRTQQSLRDCALTAVHTLTPLTSSEGIVIAVEGSSGVCAFDQKLIHRVFFNLLSNAIKASESGERVVVTISDGNRTCRVTVTDTGTGIPPAHQPHIFEKFSQVNKDWGRPHTASSGVGLAYCRLAVEAHGGRIGVHSEPGKGSTFWFELPI